VAIVTEVTSNPHPPRQKGSPAYERLSDREKLDVSDFLHFVAEFLISNLQYCTNILVPEAVIQILLWRAGKRTTVAVASDEEEEGLHKQGLELAHKLDWVNEIMQLRRTTGRSGNAQVVNKSVEMKIVGGTSTRPKIKTGKYI
jgi:hypothetical protein